jgi:uncharacterized phage protein (TIGR01671 family)
MTQRPIKFRGKSIDTKKWSYGSHYFAEITKQHFIVFENAEGRYTMVRVAPESVGQLTGLHDKNGKEIWEGDIERDLGQVIWKENEAMFGLTNGKYELGQYAHELVIIGNIYENHELLKS